MGKRLQWEKYSKHRSIMNTENWAYEHDILVHKQNHNCGIFSWRLTDWMDLDQLSLQGAKSTEIDYANISRKIALLFTCFENPEKTILSFYITGDSRICHSKLRGIEEQIWHRRTDLKKQLETFPAVWLIVINTNIPASLISFLLSLCTSRFSLSRYQLVGNVFLEHIDFTLSFALVTQFASWQINR